MSEVFGKFITDANIHYVLYYYIFFWLVNVAAYMAVAYGIRKWIPFVEGAGIEKGVKISSIIAICFGSFRFVTGLTGIILFELSVITWLETLVMLGVVSLLLNTTFITLESYVINHEAKIVMSLTKENVSLLKDAVKGFDRLRKMVDSKK